VEFDDIEQVGKMS